MREARAQVEQLKQADEASSSLSARQKAARERAARERQERVRRALELLPEAEATLQRRRNKTAADARVSTTDPEARVIVGVGVVNIGSDKGQLPPMLTQIAERLESLPNEILVDGGFPSRGSVEDAHARGVTVYAPVQKPLHPERDRYLPLAGDSDALAEWRQRMGTPAAKEIYKQRGATAECVNAHLRRYGLTRFLLRGLAKARSVLLLLALTHNLLRVQTIRRQRVTAAAA